MKICIDAGHGGLDSGAVGARGTRESDSALFVADRLRAMLQMAGLEVKMTRDTDRFITLQNRANIANAADADLFVSIHCNSAEDRQAHGFECFSYPSSAKGRALSEALLAAYSEQKLITANRGAKTAKFAVLRHTKMPAALFELGFISNHAEEDILSDKICLERFAKHLSQGVLNYLKIDVPNQTSQEFEDELFAKCLQSDKPSDTLSYTQGWEAAKKAYKP